MSRIASRSLRWRRSRRSRDRRGARTYRSRPRCGEASSPGCAQPWACSPRGASAPATPPWPPRRCGCRALRGRPPRSRRRTRGGEFDVDVLVDDVLEHDGRIAFQRLSAAARPHRENRDRRAQPAARGWRRRRPARSHPTGPFARRGCLRWRRTPPNRPGADELPAVAGDRQTASPRARRIVSSQPSPPCWRPAPHECSGELLSHSMTIGYLCSMTSAPACCGARVEERLHRAGAVPADAALDASALRHDDT